MKKISSIAVACTTLTLANLPFLASASSPLHSQYLPQPVAQAQACADPHQALQGELTWAVKESFLSYIKGPIAKGSWEVSGGAQYTGSAFTFSVSNGTTDSKGIGSAPSSGTVTFHGHGGLLRNEFQNPTLEFTGTSTAKLLMHVSAQDTEGRPITGLDGLIHLADVNFSQAITGGGTFSGTTTLTSAGARAFGGFYEPGERLADIHLNVTGQESCAPRSTPNATGTTPSNTGTQQFNFNTGHAGLDALNLLNAYLVSGTSAIDNTLTLHANMQRLLGKQSTATSPSTNQAASSPGANANTLGANSPTANQSPAVPSNGSGTQSGTPQSTNTGSPAATATRNSTTSPTLKNTTVNNSAAANSGASNTCTAVQQTQIAWGLKQSFRSYISGSIAKGGWEGQGVGDSGNAFIFNGAQGAVDTNANTGTIGTTGTLRFYGHNGKLDLRISNLTATFNDNSGQLIADVISSNVEGVSKNYGTVAIGDIHYNALELNDSQMKGTATVTLTAAGADAFAGFYEPGTELDPIAVTANLGGSSDCAASTTSATSASDGTAAQAAGTASALTQGTSAAGANANTSTSANGVMANASTAYGDQGGDGTINFLNESADGNAGISNSAANFSTSNLSPAQIIALAAAFAATAGACLRLSYKRPTQNS